MTMRSRRNGAHLTWVMVLMLTVILVGVACVVIVSPQATASLSAPSARTYVRCSTDRRPVQTGTDTDAHLVDLSRLRTTSVRELNARNRPGRYPNTQRIAPVETTVWSVATTIVWHRLDLDSGYHLVLEDRSGSHLIAKVPSPVCVDLASPFRKAIQQVRSAIQNRLNPGKTGHSVHIPVWLTGVGFFSKQHGQKGEAANGLELQPLLSVSFKAPAPGATSAPEAPAIPIPTSTAGPGSRRTPTSISARTITPTPRPSGTGHAIKTVFVIVEENHNWSSIYGSAYAPYINTSLLPQASYATQYFNPPGLHPSEPNYLWLEAGTNCFSDTGCISDDKPPSGHATSSKAHLVSLLDDAGIDWKSYQENITNGTCPLADSAPYAVRHNPFVFFKSVTTSTMYCAAHERDYSDLASDLANDTVARYNFITPNVCNDGHDKCPPANNPVKQTDTWLSQHIPTIMRSQAYKNGGAIFVTWDEGEGGDGPIGMMVLSPVAKGNGYHTAIHYTHSSTLRTLEEIFGVGPMLGGAATATDLADLFTVFP